MIKPTYITRPALRAPAKPDVSTHEDIDWRTVSVTEAIDAEREQAEAMRAKLAALRVKRKPGKWAVLLQVLGVRHAR